MLKIGVYIGGNPHIEVLRLAQHSGVSQVININFYGGITGKGA